MCDLLHTAFNTHVRGGSRVVQVISRNHSNVSKPAFVISQVLHGSSRNQLSVLFYCLLSNKAKKKASYLVIPYPALPERIRRVSVRALSSFVDTSENNAKNIVGTTGEICTQWVGLDGIWIVHR